MKKVFKRISKVLGVVLLICILLSQSVFADVFVPGGRPSNHAPRFDSKKVVGWVLLVLLLAAVVVIVFKALIKNSDNVDINIKKDDNESDSNNDNKE